MGDSKGRGGTSNRKTIVQNIQVAQRWWRKGAKVIIANFEVDKSILKDPDHTKPLDDLINYINKISTYTSIIGLEGRASDTGPEKRNYELSKERVRVVQSYLRRKGIIVKDNQIAALGKEDPLPIDAIGSWSTDATSRLPVKDEENAANRSVMIYLKYPPIAVARALDGKGFEVTKISYTYNSYYGKGESPHPDEIFLDGTKSIRCGDFKIVGYSWYQWFTDGTSRTQVVELQPKPTSVEYDLHMESRSDWVASFKVREKLMDNKFHRLYFRLFITDENNFTVGSKELEITIEPRIVGKGGSFGPKINQWALKMVGSVSLTILGRGIRRSAKMAEGEIELGVGGMAAIGLLKKINPQPSIRLFCFFGAGGGLSLSGSYRKRGEFDAFDGWTRSYGKNASKIKKLKEILEYLGLDIDNPLQDFTNFGCHYTEFYQFDGTPALISTKGIAFFVGWNWSYLDFRGLTTYPEEIDIGGPFGKAKISIGVEANWNYGIIRLFSTLDELMDMLPF